MCGQFIYGGCKGNENRFESEVDCEQKCKEPSTKRKFCAMTANKLSLFYISLYNSINTGWEARY